MEDKRDDQRRRLLKEGKIVFNAGSSVIDCVIRNQSKSGAKLQVPAPTALPKNFELLCITDAMLFPAELIWRRGDDLGIAFIGDPRASARK